MKNNYNKFSYNTLKHFAIAILLIVPLYVSAQPMTGSYTINSAVATGGTNFQSFTAFAAALTANGVSGPVTATVDPGSGPYTEQVVFQSITGTGPAATITIEGNGEIIGATTTSINRHVVRLSSLQYFTINNLNVDCDPASAGGFYGIHIFGTGNNITISNCNIDISGFTSTLFGSIVASGSETSILETGDFHNITITGNTTTGGGYGVSLFGLVSNLASGIDISNNTIYDFHTNGIYLRETDGAIVSNNILDKRTSNVNSANFIQMAQSANINGQIFNNIISVSQTSNGNSILRGIYLFGGTGHRVYNNVIHDIRLTSGDFSGIEVRAASSAPEIYYNTISIDNAASTSGILLGIGEELSNTNSIIKNNIISISQSTTGEKAGLALGATSTVSNLNSDFNIIYVPGGHTAMKSGLSPTYYTTLAAWQAASSDDANSISTDPVFTSAALSIPTSVLANDAGTPVASVTTDITGAIRGTPPDAGAYEFIPSGIKEVSANKLLVYPNPASGHIILPISIQETASIQIYDLSGKMVSTEIMSSWSDEIVIDVSNLQSGSYVVRTENSATPFIVLR